MEPGGPNPGSLFSGIGLLPGLGLGEEVREQNLFRLYQDRTSNVQPGTRERAPGPGSHSPRVLEPAASHGQRAA